LVNRSSDRLVNPAQVGSLREPTPPSGCMWLNLPRGYSAMVVPHLTFQDLCLHLFAGLTFWRGTMVRHFKGSCGPFDSSACMHVWLKESSLLEQLYFVPHLSIRQSTTPHRECGRQSTTPHPSLPNPQPSTLNPQPSTLKPSTLKPSTLKPSNPKS
jgi:hypothetical protein